MDNKNNKLKENDDKDDYNNLPTDKFEEINFKSVLEKNIVWNN